MRTMAVLATWSPVDPLLGVVAPLALAASVTTALVVDLDPDAPPLPVASTLAGLVERGPTRAELAPDRRGVAVLANGGISAEVAAPVVEALIEGWPHVALRVPERTHPLAACVPVLPLLPSEIVGDHGKAVYQRVAWSAATPPGSIILPRPSAAAVGAILALRRPLRGRWLRAWRRVWAASWV